MIPVYPSLNVMFFKFLFIQYFWVSLLFNDIPYLKKLYLRKVTTRSDKNVSRLCFCFILVVFMQKGSHPKSFADLIRFQPRVKDPICIIVLINNIIAAFIYSFMFLQLFMDEKNQRIICKISDENNIFCLRVFRYISSNPLPQIHAPFKV